MKTLQHMVVHSHVKTIFIWANLERVDNILANI
jgi:hypothetical protein